MIDFIRENWAIALYVALVLFLSLMSLRERRQYPVVATGDRDLEFDLPCAVSSAGFQSGSRPPPTSPERAYPVGTFLAPLTVARFSHPMPPGA